MTSEPFARTQRGIATWTLLGVLLLGAVLGGALVALWIFRNVDARLLLTEQPAKVTLPDDLPITAEILKNLQIRLDETVNTTVPVDQQVTIPVRDTLNLMVEIDDDIPLKLDVRVQDEITIDQVLDIDAVIDANFLGDWHKLPIRGKVPVKATVPIDLLIPVDQKVRITLRSPVKAKLRDDLVVPLKTDISADVPISGTFNVPVLTPLEARVTLPDEPLDIVINYADLVLPLRTLRLGLKDETTPAADGSSRRGRSTTSSREPPGRPSSA